MDTSFKEEIKYVKPKILTYKDFDVETQLYLEALYKKKCKQEFSLEQMIEILKLKFDIGKLDLNEARIIIKRTLDKLERKHIIAMNKEGNYIIEVPYEDKEELIKY